MFRILTITIGLMLAASPLRAQMVGGQWETAWSFDGIGSGDLFGSAVACAGDVDADGVTDLIVGARDATWGGISNAGAAYVYSGATGLPIHEFHGLATDDDFGVAVAGAGDFDGDGKDDLVVGAPEADPAGVPRGGSVYVFSGADGTLLFQRDGVTPAQTMGISVAPAGDIDGDGFDDILVGADGAGVGGEIYLLAGPNGSQMRLMSLANPSSNDWFGRSVAAVGDVDGDGTSDFLVGAPGYGFGGAAFLFSGANGAQQQQFFATAQDEFFGESVAGPGDTDGDSVPDLFVGARSGNPTGSSAVGSAFLYSGATGGLLHRFDGQAFGDDFGESVAGIDDLDGDWLPDLIIGAPRADTAGGMNSGAVYYYSGMSGALLHRYDGGTPGGMVGQSVASGFDVNRDGVGDAVFGAHFTSSGGLLNNGAVLAYRLSPFLYASAPSLSVSNGTAVHFGLSFPATEAGKRYALLASATGTGPSVVGGLEIPLTQDSLLGLFLSGSAPAFMQGAYGTLNGNAQARATLPAVPALAPAVGSTIHFGAVTFDVGPPTGRMSSVSRALVIEP